MNSSSSGTRSSETPTAQWGPSFPVHIYIYHSPRIAKVFFPESYSNLDDSLFKPPNAEELKRWLRGVQSHVHMTWLSENLPGCYTLQLSDPRNDTLKDLLQRLEGECGLPQSIASHFTLFDNGTKLREPRPVQFQATVLQALAMALTDKDDMTSLEERERSCLRLIMVTTAAAAGHLTGCWFLDKNVPNPTSRRRRSLPPAIVGRWKWWLHTWYAVKYLRSALTRGQEDLEMLRTKLKDYERQERFQSHWLAISFWNWRKLIEGSEECSAQIEPEDLDERRSFIDEEYRRLRKITIKFCEEYMSDAPRPAHSVPIEDHPGSGASSKTGDALEEEELASDNTLGKQRSEPGFRQREADRSYKWFGPEPAPSLASTYTIPTRNRDGRLNSDSTFTVRTGILLWGHIMQVYSGSLDTEFTGNATSVPPEYRAGTIKRQKFTYRSAARNGTWKLRRAYTNFDPTTGGSDDGDPPVRQFGWIMHHEDIDAEETITRCSVIGAYGQIGNAFANGNTHADKVVQSGPPGRILDMPTSSQHPCRTSYTSIDMTGEAHTIGESRMIRLSRNVSHLSSAGPTRL